jgi:hypothetical protein
MECQSISAMILVRLSFRFARHSDTIALVSPVLISNRSGEGNQEHSAEQYGSVTAKLPRFPRRMEDSFLQEERFDSDPSRSDLTH